MDNEQIIKTAVEYKSYFGTLDRAIEVLEKAKEENENIYLDFNGQKLYSLIDDTDSCYLKVTGKTKDEYMKALEEWRKQQEEEQIKEELEALDKMPDRIKRGNELIYPQRREDWEKYVRSSTKSFYHGLELDSVLNVMESLSKDKNLEQALSVLNSEDKKGVPNFITLNIIAKYSKQGVDFCKYACEKKNIGISKEDLDYLAKLKEENKQFESELENPEERE